MASAASPPFLSVKEAAARLGMTPQGVRKAVRDHRLQAGTRLLANGKREYTIAAEAVEAFQAERGSALGGEVESLRVRLALAEGAVREREREILELQHKLDETKGQLRRTARALAKQVEAFNAFLGEDETQTEAVRGMA